MLNKNIEQLQKIIEVCDIHLKRLNNAFRNVFKLLPFSEEKYNNLTDEQIAYIDQYIFRFSKLQDTIGEKLFKQILVYSEEQIENLTFRDILNKMEKFRIIDNHETWNKLRETRNDISHEYPVITNEAIIALNELFILKKDLENIYNECLLFLYTSDIQKLLKIQIEKY